MGKQFRAYRACDTDLSKVKYPCGVMPKIDGVRALNPYGTLLTRTLAFMPNRFTRENFSGEAYRGFDGELACGIETDDDLCRKTVSAVMSHEGEPTVVWHVFDLCEPNVSNKPYEERYAMLKNWIEFQHGLGKLLDLKVVPLEIVNNEEELLEWEERWLEMGYEGLIQRDLKAVYKWGRSTARESGYTRRKPYEDTEGVLIDVFEAEENLNEAFTDAQGLTKRSTHKENKVGKGMAGPLMVRRLDNGEYARIGPGKLTHAERIHLWETRHEAIENEMIVKFRHFPKGVKDKPRQARFLSWRDINDILPPEDDDE
jgi:DNA ligase-1